MRRRFRRPRAAAERPRSPQTETIGGLFPDAPRKQQAIESRTPDELVVRHVERDGRQTLLLSGALSLDSVETLESAVRELQLETVTAVTLDLTALVFIDSSGLWAITTVRRWCKQAMTEFSIIPGPASVQDVFELTGLSDLLPFETDRKADRRPTSWE